MRYLLAVAMMFFTVQAHAVSIDVSALKTGESGQIIAVGNHIQQNPKSMMNVGGRYAKTEGRDADWDMGVSSEFYYPYGIRSEGEFRYFQDRTTYASGLGFGQGFLTLVGGFRIDSPDDAPRQTYGRFSAVFRGKYKGVAFSARAEALRASADDNRLDYKAEGKYQWEHLYLAARVEELRHRKLQGLSFGFKW